MLHLPFPVSLNSRPLIVAEQGWGSPQVDRSVQGLAMRMGGKRFTGIGTHAKSDFVYALERRYQRFSATVGIDDEMKGFVASSISFTVIGDGRQLWSSGVIHHGDFPKSFDLDVRGVDSLELKVGDGGDGINGDHADWGDPELVPVESAPAPDLNRVHLKGADIRIDGKGEIRSVKFGTHSWLPVSMKSWIEGAAQVGASMVQMSQGQVLIERKLQLGRTVCFLSDRLASDGGAIRWKIDIRSLGPTISAPITTHLNWSNHDSAKFWAAWNDPIGPSTQSWHDPLASEPFASRSWSYGETGAGDWTSGDVVTLPMFSVMPDHGDSVSFIQSPNDPLPEARLATSVNGESVFSRNHLRLGSRKKVSFTSFLVEHRTGWRSALKAIDDRFPSYFRSPLSSAKRLEGCGAYSGDERLLSRDQTDRLQKMDFSTMWKLSDDYAYMGMFLPPTRNSDEPWSRTPDGGSPAGYKPLERTVTRMNEYARMLKARGFHLLDYFNACEFGVNMKEVPALSQSGSDDWKNSSQYLADNFPKAPLPDNFGKPLGAWQGGWAMDPGDPKYREYLLGQARVYMDRIPDSDGVCIDRADYLRLHNSKADDGVSWYDGPARSLVFSWKALLDPLGNEMHGRGKAIFSNLMDPRLDLTGHLDGLYCEFGNVPTVLNGASVLCLNKPLLLWTTDSDVLSDDYFQRELYLGAFPTAPYSTNNHCIQPSPEHDRWYLDYGPLFAALKGRVWDLEEGSVSVDHGAKVNLFRKGDGFVAVIAFAGGEDHVRLDLRGVGGLKGKEYKVLIPGQPVKLGRILRRSKGSMTLEVPVHRGCAVVEI